MFNRLNYQRPALEHLYQSLPPEQRDEMAIPSYLHTNPLITWIVAWRMGVVLSLADVQPGQHVLDFGCGTGMLLLQLPAGQGTYYGVDLFLEPARYFLSEHNRSDITLLSPDQLDAAIPDHSLHRIIALEVLEHVPDVGQLAAVFARKLHPGGALIVSGPTENAFYQLARRVAGFSGEYHHRNITTILADIRAAGFTPQQRRSLPMPGPLALFEVSRLHPS